MANRIIGGVFSCAALYSLPRFLEYYTNVHTVQFSAESFISNETLIETIETVTAETTEIGRSYLFINIVSITIPNSLGNWMRKIKIIS